MGINTVEINKDNFKKFIEENKNKLVLVDFWASWCGPCRMVEPVIEEVAEEYKDKIVVGKVNVDEEKELTMMFGIRSIPTIIFFNEKGEIIDSIVGAVPKSFLVEKIERILT